MTGSTTTWGSLYFRTAAAMACIWGMSYTMPIFTASGGISSQTAAICCSRNAAGTGHISRTPVVFCAVSAVMALMPKQPSMVMVFKSAWMPAPPLLSLPAMVRTGAMVIGAAPFSETDLSVHAVPGLPVSHPAVRTQRRPQPRRQCRSCTAAECCAL